MLALIQQILVGATLAAAPMADTAPRDTAAAAGDSGAAVPSLATARPQGFETWRAELPGASGPASPAAPADTVRRRPRAKAIEYSSFYSTRLTIHRIASYTMIPLFVTQYIAGRDLFDHGDSASAFARKYHRPLATGITVLFGVNTVTGVWNLLESRHDPNGRTRRTVHSIMMLLADGGFAATGIVASDARNSQSKRELHRTLALSSMGVALASDLMMLVWKD